MDEQQILAGIKEKFIEVRKLLDDVETLAQSKQYTVKCSAITILKDVEVQFINLLKTKSEFSTTVLLALVDLNLGLLYIDTEESTAGEDKFMKCLQLLEGNELKPKSIQIVVSALNQLGILWSQLNQQSKAKMYLEQAEQFYKDFISTENEHSEPVNMMTNFGIEDITVPKPTETLEKMHLLTLYYLAQVYGLLEEHYKAAVYCHMTLRGQLKYHDSTQEFEYVDWAVSAATLSQVFMERGNFTAARHHLAAALHILSKYENILKEKSRTNPQSEELAAEWENYKHRSADVARCWAKYGILLLGTSKERLMEKIEQYYAVISTESKGTCENPKEKIEEDLNQLKFDVLEQDIKVFVDDVTDKYVLDFHDARAVFLNIQKWLEKAKTYYTLDSHASDYVQIAQDMSQAYKYLLFFEEDEDRQAKMHKRRIDILENVLNELNPQYYRDACRQIWIELGETYSDILDIKLERLETTDGKLTAHALTKINHLAKSSIKNFETFLDSLNTNTRDVDKAKFPDDIMQPALGAYFHLGRLYNKIITPDKSVQLENLQNSMNAYKFVVDYCEKNPKAAELMKLESGLCKELLSLLPLKIGRLREDLNKQQSTQ